MLMKNVAGEISINQKFYSLRSDGSNDSSIESLEIYVPLYVFKVLKIWINMNVIDQLGF